MLPESRASIADLHRVDGQAELIGGTIVRFPPSRLGAGRAAGRIALSLNDHAEAIGRGEAGMSTLGYVVAPLASGRESFCPDASYHVGPFPDDPMGFIEAAPTFAVEVRDLDDYSPGAEGSMAAKRADYFEAGTLVVWDVDIVAKAVAVYRADAPTSPIVYGPGQEAEAEPAVPGWRMAVDRIFA